MHKWTKTKKSGHFFVLELYFSFVISHLVLTLRHRISHESVQKPLSPGIEPGSPTLHSIWYQKVGVLDHCTTKKDYFEQMKDILEQVFLCLTWKAQPVSLLFSWCPWNRREEWQLLKLYCQWDSCGKKLSTVVMYVTDLEAVLVRRQVCHILLSPHVQN